jgi:hypothetical protein
VDGVTYDHDLIIDRGEIRKRKKGASRQFRGAYGRTPLSAAERLTPGTPRRDNGRRPAGRTARDVQF